MSVAVGNFQIKDNKSLWDNDDEETTKTANVLLKSQGTKNVNNHKR